MRAVLGGEPVNPPIGQATANAALQDQCSALPVVHIAGVVAQIELGTVAAKVRLTHMVIGANYTAFENGEEVFSGVAVLETARCDILAGAVVDRAVPVKFAAHAGVDRAFVGHKVRGAVNVGHDQSANVLGIDVGDMEAAGFAIALDKRHDCLFGCRLAGGAVTGLAADIGFVGFNYHIRTTERAGRSRAVHRFADAMTEKPCGAIGDAQHTFHLLRAHALLGSGHKVKRQQPLVQRNVAALHDRAGADGELFAAIIALEITNHLAF